MNENKINIFDGELINNIVDWIDSCYKETNIVYDMFLKESQRKRAEYYHLYKIEIQPVVNFKMEDIRVKLHFINELGSSDLREHDFNVPAEVVKKIIENDLDWFDALYKRLSEVMNNEKDYFFSAKNVRSMFSLNSVSNNLKGKQFYNIGFFDYILKPGFASSFDFRLDSDSDLFGIKNSTLVVRFGRHAEQIYFNLNSDLNNLLGNTTIIKEGFFKEIREAQIETIKRLERAKNALSNIEGIINKFSEEDRLLFEVNVQ